MNPEHYRRLAAAGLNVDQIGVVMDVMAESEAALKAAEDCRKSVARERVQRWREKNKTNVTLQKRNGNATVRLTRREGSSSREDITNKEDSVSPSAQPKRASRLSAEWVIPDEWLQEAINAGLSRQRALSEAERMKNWSLSNKNGAKLDWLAAWRNWYRDKADPQILSKPPPDRPPRNAGEAARLELKRMENYDAASTQIRYDDQSDGSPGFAGTGIARRIAIASSR